MIWRYLNGSTICSAAARAVKKNRGTIHNYLKSGRLSCIKDVNGHPKIDTSELLRVFGELSTNGNIQPKNATENMIKTNHVQQPDSGVVDILKEQLKAAQEREKRLLEMLEQEQQARLELERRFIALPEGQTKKTSWLSRLLGKN